MIEVSGKTESLRIAMFSWESLHSAKIGGLAPHVTELSDNLVKIEYSWDNIARNTVHVYN
ncbi:hypothetical protein [Methanolobus sp. ZRKC5]|uniref:hypothetical protein n=1 Tax=unclassified Methanolobus TaxID=2629569 RepID=UPI00313E17DF